MPRSLPALLRWLLTEEETGFEKTTLQGYRSAWRDLLECVEDPFYWRQLDEAPAKETVPEDVGFEEVLEEVMEGTGTELPPPEKIAEYLRSRSDFAWSTLTTRRQAIRLVYDRLLGGEDPFDHPEVEKVWTAIREEKRQEPKRKEKRRLEDRDHGPTEIIERGPSLLSDHLGGRAGQDLKYLPEETAFLEGLTDEVKTLIPAPTFELDVLRDRALLLLVATTNAARTTLVRIDIEDVCPLEEEGHPTGIVMYGSRGAPTGLLRLENRRDVDHCPNRAVAAWILAAGLTAGPLFRSFTPHGAIRDSGIRPQTINRAIKRWAEEAGFDPSDWSTRRLRPD